MKIDSIIHLDISERDGADIKKLCDQLTYDNPKFQDVKRLGFSTHGIPPLIKNYGISSMGEFLTTTRGEIRKVRAIWPDEPIEEDSQYHLHYVNNFRYENNDFDLDVRQLRAVQAIKKKKQGIIHAATSAGKSAIIMASIASRNVRTIVIVHRKILQEQLLADAKKWLKGCTFGTIGGSGKSVLDADVTFAIDKSLGRLLEARPELRNQWGMVVSDECHLSPCSTFQSIISKLDAPYRYGLTGTLKRKDRMEFMIFATYGEVIATITKDELLDADRVSPVEVNVIESDAEVDPAFFDLPVTKKFQAIDKSLHENDSRGLLIANKVIEIAESDANARIVILSRYVEPCYRLGSMIRPDFLPVFVTGQENDPSTACKALEDGDNRIMCATVGCFSTGVNIPNLTDIILISPIFNNELLIHQIRGRLMRKSEGKTHGTLHFIWDQYVFPSHKLNRFKSIMKK